VSVTKTEDEKEKERRKNGENRDSAGSGGSGEIPEKVPVLAPPRSYKEWALQQKERTEKSDRNKEKSKGVEGGMDGGKDVITSVLNNNGDNVNNANNANKAVNNNGNNNNNRNSNSNNNNNQTRTNNIKNTPVSPSNPLMCVSKEWLAVSRVAMSLEWRRGSCVEWQVLGEIMSNERVTKVRPTARARTYFTL
jgi:hypothetical protein